MHLVLADPTDGTNIGGVFVGILLLAAIVALAIWYNRFKYRGFRTRTVTSQLSVDQLRTIFEQTVSGKSWSIVDDGNPIVAQSNVLTGIRQQIALTTEPLEHGTRAQIAVLRYSKKVLGGPTKAYTLRWRIDAFLGAVRSADVNANVAG